MTFGSGTSAAGIAFNDGVFGRVWAGFQLPWNYVGGTNVQIDMHWIPVSGFGAHVFPCNVVFWANGPYVHRPDVAAFYLGSTWEIPRGFDNTQTRLPATNDLFTGSIISQTYMTIDGTNLQPGDMVNFALNRDGDETDDTCEGIMVTGLEVHAG